MDTLSHQYRLCHKVAKDKPEPPHREEGVKPFSGFIIVRLQRQFSDFTGDDMAVLLKEYKLERLAALLDKYKPQAIRRSIVSVSVPELRRLEKMAENSEFPPLHSLAQYWRLDYRNYEGNPDELVRLFGEIREVELAYKEMSVSDPAINPGDDTFAANQGYLDAAPNGIDARWVWMQVNGEGAGVGFIDLEQGWIPTHEDLAAANPTLVYNSNRHGVGSYVGNHGTAVLGEVIGVDNNRGVVGIAPSVSYVKMVSHYEAATNTALHVADAIVAAITHMNAGDVLLLEVARGAGPEYPTEIDDTDFDAIRLAVANGMIVVEAGGNGDAGGVGHNLDTWTTGAGKFRMKRGHVDFKDSGALMVGAATSTVPHNRMPWSNYGSRIDCYAWGENVVSTGYGNLAGGGTATLNDNYTQSFNGTSSASPIIVGAALLLQGMYKATAASILAPLQMRALLSNPATGTAQGAGVAGNIGVMPNLRSVIENTLELTPDVYIRDYAGDNGNVPSTGALSTSPDIIVRPDSVANPTAAFGEGSGTENSNTLGYKVESGQDNYIYVRMKNRGGSAANGVTATIYWSEVSTLVTPNLWHLIGTTTPVNVPIGDTLVVADELVWTKNTIPAAGHYCFVGILQHAQDPAPPIPGPVNFDWNDFTAFIKNNNNATWRNFNVEDLLPNDPNVAFDFNITGAPDKARNFDIEIMRALPENAQLWLEIPYNLYAFMQIRSSKVIIDEKKLMVRVLLPQLRKITVCNVPLPKEAKFKCRFVVEGKSGFERGVHHIAIRQLFEEFEVGRITWALRTGDEKKVKRVAVKK